MSLFKLHSIGIILGLPCGLLGFQAPVYAEENRITQLSCTLEELDKSQAGVLSTADGGSGLLALDVGRARTKISASMIHKEFIFLKRPEIKLDFLVKILPPEKNAAPPTIELSAHYLKKQGRKWALLTTGSPIKFDLPTSSGDLLETEFTSDRSEIPGIRARCQVKRINAALLNKAQSPPAPCK